MKKRQLSFEGVKKTIAAPKKKKRLKKLSHFGHETMEEP